MFRGSGTRTSRKRAEEIGALPSNFPEDIPYDCQAGMPVSRYSGPYIPQPAMVSASGPTPIQGNPFADGVDPFALDVAQVGVDKTYTSVVEMCRALCGGFDDPLLGMPTDQRLGSANMPLRIEPAPYVVRIAATGGK